MKIKSILIALVLIVALVGAGFLVKNNQETRSGASYASVEMLFLPTEKTLRVGEKLTTTFMIDTKDRFLTGADLRIKYNKSVLKLENVEVVTIKTPYPIKLVKVPWLKDDDEIIVSNIYEDEGIYELVGATKEKETRYLAKGVVDIVKLNFVAIANGEAVVGLDRSYRNMITGYNETGLDQELGISGGNNAFYKVVGPEVGVTRRPMETECIWCGEACIEKSEKENFACLDVIPTDKRCISQNGQCVVVDGYATE